MKTKQTAINTLRNDVYDLLVQSFNRNSKFYNEDCDALWAGLVKKSNAELRETLQRQTAIRNVTRAEIERHCQF